MIIEQLKNWRGLFSGPAWEAAFSAIENLSADAPAGKTALLGDLANPGGADAFFAIADYSTKPEPECKLEAHREFIDIHFTLHGAERIGWWPVDELQVRTPYNNDKDVVFFEHPAGAPPACVVLRPGMFVVMFPNDAHMPKLMVAGQAGTLRKGVVKIRVSLAGRQ